MALITVTLKLVRPTGSNDEPAVSSGYVELTPISPGKYQDALRTMETLTRPIINGEMAPVELTPGAWTVTVFPARGKAWSPSTYVITEDMEEPVSLGLLAPDITINGTSYLKGDQGIQGDPGPGVSGGYLDDQGRLVLTLENGGETEPLVIPEGPKGDPGADSTVPGPANSLEIGVVTTGDPGTDAFADITGESPSQTLNLTIPQGPQGIKGDKGDKGNDSTVPGPQGPPGAVATAGTYLLVGPGRPDSPSSTGGVITGSEPVGAEYRSTDGAGTGAWVWMKRPSGWKVVAGDTGWLDVTHLINPNYSGSARLKRENGTVMFSPNLTRVSGTGDMDLFPGGIPAGFRMPYGASPGSIYGYNAAWKPLRLDDYSKLRIVDGGAALVRDMKAWSTDDTWPTSLT